MIVYSIYCKRHSASHITVLQKIFKRVTFYLHTFSCTRVNCEHRIPQQLRRMTLDALQSKPACARNLKAQFTPTRLEIQLLFHNYARKEKTLLGKVV